MIAEYAVAENCQFLTNYRRAFGYVLFWNIFLDGNDGSERKIKLFGVERMLEYYTETPFTKLEG
jgi:hypothetical protein